MNKNLHHILRQLYRVIAAVLLVASVTLLLPTAGTQVAFAESTRLIPFSARLKNPLTESVVANGDYTLTFRIYDSATGGNLLWTEAQTTTVTNGVVSLMLGSLNAFPADLNFQNSSYWLEVQVNSDAPLSPRKQVGSVASALNANRLDGASKGTGANNVLQLDNSGNINIQGGAQLGSALAVTGAATFSSTLAVTGAASITGDLTVKSNILANSNGLNIGSSSQRFGTAYVDVIDATTSSIGGTTNADFIINSDAGPSETSSVRFALGSGTYSALQWNASTNQFDLLSDVSSATTADLKVGHLINGTNTVTLPNATTTLVGTDATQTLTNKTLNADTVTGTLTGSSATITGFTTINGATISGGTLLSNAVNGLGITSGTVTSGTWNGNPIGVAYGGTGMTSYTAGDLIYATGSTTLSKIGTAGHEGQYLTVSGGLPVWSTVATGGTITAVNAGNGLSGGGSSGAVTLSIDTNFSNNFGVAQQVSANGNALKLTGTPSANGTSSQLQLGGPITSGSSNGTYITVNEPAAGNGSTADFVNLLNNNSSKFSITSTGAVTEAAGLTVSSGGATITGNSTISGSLSSLTGLSSSGTITFSGLTASKAVFTDNSSNLTTTGTLGVNQGGTGLSTVASGSLLYGNGTGALNTLSITGSNGLCLSSDGAAPKWVTCSGGVNTVNGETGAVTIANASGNGSGTVTINDASTSSKGIASFNSTNFTVTSGAVNTIQDIATTSSPTFSGLTLTTVGVSGLASFTRTGANAVKVNGNPLAGASGASSSLVQVGPNAISGGNNTTTTGGTFIGINASSSGAGSTADFLNFQNGGISQYNVSATGAVIQNGSLTVSNGGATITGNSTLTGTLSGLTGLSSSGTVNFSGLTASKGVFTDGSSNLTTTGTLGVAQGGTGATSFTTNGVLYGNGTSAIQVTAAGTNGNCLIYSGGVPQWGSCSGSGSGVTLQNAYNNGNTITTNNASDIAFTLADTATDSNFITNIASGSTSKFAIQNAGADVLSVTATGGLTLGTSSAQNGQIVFKNSSNSNTTTLAAGAPSSSSISFTLPNSYGSNGNCLLSDGSGGLTFAGCTGGAGGGLTSLNGNTGVQTLNNATATDGAHITINNAAADGSTKGIATFNSSNFSASSGVINTSQDLFNTASPTFAALTLNQTSNSNGLAVTGSSSETTSDLLSLTNNVFALSSAGTTVSNVKSSFTNKSTNSSGTTTTAALTINPTVNVTSGAGVHNTVGVNLGAVTNTACSAGTCNKYGIYAGSSNNYTDLFDYNGNTVITNAGLLGSFALNGTYSNALTLSNGSNSISVGSLTATGGSIDGTTIGTSTAAAGNFTSIGATTKGTGAFTSLTADNGVTLANVSGNVAIGNGSGTLSLASSGGLNVTTSGALTGVASIDTITVSSTALTFAGAGTIKSTGTGNALTLDSGTTGAVNLGTGNNAKTVNIGTGTGGNTINIGTDNTAADAINIGTSLDTVTVGGTINAANLTASQVIFTDSSKNLTSVGQVDVAHGGTGLASVTSGSLLYGNGTSALNTLSITGTNGLCLISNGSAPTWTSCTSGSGVGTITAVNAGTGLTGGGSSGSVTLALDQTGAYTWSGLQTFSKTGANAVAVTGTPLAGTSGASSSLVQIGPNAISGGNNTTTTGGTYLGINAPTTSAGSTADFLNFQVGGSSKIKFDITGNATFAGTINTATITGGNISGGTINGASINGGSLDGSTVNGLGVSSGVITSGVYHGTAIGANYGGTGQTSYTVGDLLYAGSTGSPSSLSLLSVGGSANGSCLVLSSGLPSWGSCAGSGAGGVTLQAAYANGATIATTDARDLAVTLTDTATDPNFLVNIASGSTGRFAVQGAGSDILAVKAGSTSDILTLSESLAPTATNTANGEKIALTNTSANGSSTTSTVNGILFAPTVSQGSGTSGSTHNTISVNLGTVTSTCGVGVTCNNYGIYAPSSNSYTDLFDYNGNTVITSAGLVGSFALNGTYSNALTLSNSSNSITAGTLTATGGTINGTTIGTTSAAAGNFTSIGATTAGTGAFTTLNSTQGASLATSSGNVALGNGSGTFAVTSSGGLNVSTAGALTGVASIDTIATSSTALTFAGAGTVSSTSSSAITVDSGTTGTVNLGTGNNAKTINIGTGTAGDTINIGTNNTVADTIAIGSALDTFSVASTAFNVSTAGLISSTNATSAALTLSGASAGISLSGTGTHVISTGNSTDLAFQPASGNVLFNTASTNNVIKLYDSNGGYGAITGNYVNSNDELQLSSSSTVNQFILGNTDGTAVNLVFENSASIQGNGAKTITLGNGSDTFNLNTSGTTYNVGTLSTSSGGVTIAPAGTSGDAVAVNAASGFTGNLLNLKLNGTSKLSIDQAGNVTIPAFTAYGSLYASSAGTITSLTPGTSGYCLTSGGSSAAPTWANCSTGSAVLNANNNFTPTVTTGTGTSAGLAVTANSLTTGQAVEISSTSLTGGTLLDVASTSAAQTNNSKGINVFLSGANPGTGTTTYGLYVSNARSNSSTNYGGYFTTSNCSTCYSLGVSGVFQNQIGGSGYLTTGVISGTDLGFSFASTTSTTNYSLMGNGTSYTQLNAPGSSGAVVFSVNGTQLAQWTNTSSVNTLQFSTAGTINTAGNLALSVDSGGTGALNIGTGANAKTITLGTTGAASQTIAIGTGTSAQTINIGTGAAANTITIGSTTSGSVTNIKTGSSGGVTIGDGGTTNYTKFDQNGAITFAGSARPTSELFLIPNDATPGTGAGYCAATNNTGSGGTYYKTADCDTTNKDAFWTFKMPKNYVNGSNLTVDVYWEANDSNSAHSATFNVGLAAATPSTTATIDGASVTDTAGSAVNATTTAYSIQDQTVTVTSPSVNADDLVNLRLRYNSGTVTTVKVLKVRVKYTVGS